MKKVLIGALTLTSVSSFAFTCKTLEVNTNQETICAEVDLFENQRGLVLTGIKPAIAVKNGTKNESAKKLCELFSNAPIDKVQVSTKKNQEDFVVIAGKNEGWRGNLTSEWFFQKEPVARRIEKIEMVTCLNL